MIETEPLHGWTEQQLGAIPHVGKLELVHGKIIMSPASFDHGFIASIILSRLLSYALEHNLGAVVDSSTGFRLKNEDLLAPDVSFVSAARLGGGAQPIRRFFSGSPDLAVEVLSPGDVRSELDGKLRALFDDGTRIAWVVDPTRKTVEVLHSGGQSQQLSGNDSISGEDLLPGFSLALAEIFRPYVR